MKKTPEYKAKAGMAQSSPQVHNSIQLDSVIREFEGMIGDD
jgi:hypothetical protein